MFDFSSTFNTIHLVLLRNNIDYTGVEQHLINWIMDYLTNRPQHVRTRDCVSDRVLCGVGSPPGNGAGSGVQSIRQIRQKLGVSESRRGGREGEDLFFQSKN